ncbi:thermonuclease family protein [Pseudoxanthomonas mexicana]
MARKVVVHSNAKRFVQVAAVAILAAATLTGLKKASQWWRAPHEVPETMAVATAPAARSAATNVLAGRSSVIDADTLEVHGTRIRLEGVDAPESSQRCGTAETEWACGQQAALALSDWIAERPVTCHPKGTDRYQRVLARCFVGNDDLQAWLVSNGWALAYRQYSTDYVAAEQHARAARVGMWQGEFVPPWEWRKQGR